VLSLDGKYDSSFVPPPMPRSFGLAPALLPELFRKTVRQWLARDVRLVIAGVELSCGTPVLHLGGKCIAVIDKGTGCRESICL
jgi:hypothetical protein